MSIFEDEAVDGVSADAVELAPESETGAAEVVADGESTIAEEAPTADEVGTEVSDEPSAEAA